MSMDKDGGMILTVENQTTRRKTCSSATLSTNPTWIVMFACNDACLVALTEDNFTVMSVDGSMLCFMSAATTK
jgi:hypothetical protein